MVEPPTLSRPKKKVLPSPVSKLGRTNGKSQDSTRRTQQHNERPNKHATSARTIDEALRVSQSLHRSSLSTDSGHYSTAALPLAERLTHPCFRRTVSRRGQTD